MSEEQKLKCSKARKKFIKTLTEQEKHNLFSRKYTDEQKEHLSKVLKERSHKLTLEEKLKISNSLKGRNTWTKDRIWIHNNDNRKCVNKEELDNFLTNGWHKGMYKDKCKLCSSTTIENGN